MQPCSCLLRGGSQTTDIGQRLKRAGARIEKCAGIGGAAGASCRFIGIEKADGSAPRCPLFTTLANFGEPFFTDGAMQCAILFDLAGNRVFFHQFAHQQRRITQKAEKPFPVGFAQHAGQLPRHDPHAAVDETDIAAGAAKTDFPGFEKNDIHAFFSKMKGGGLSGEAAADNHHIGNRLALQCRRSGRLRRGLFPEAVRAGVIIHRSTIFRASSFVFRMSDKSLFMRLYKWLHLLNIDISSRVHSVREYGSTASPLLTVAFAACGL